MKAFVAIALLAAAVVLGVCSTFTDRGERVEHGMVTIERSAERGGDTVLTNVLLDTVKTCSDQNKPNTALDCFTSEELMARGGGINWLWMGLALALAAVAGLILTKRIWKTATTSGYPHDTIDMKKNPKPPETRTRL